MTFSRAVIYQKRHHGLFALAANAQPAPSFTQCLSHVCCDTVPPSFSLHVGGAPHLSADPKWRFEYLQMCIVLKFMGENTHEPYAILCPLGQ